MRSKANKILIVDDEEDLTWSISKSLLRENDLLEIICVHSGDEALKVLEKISIDLVISDIRMPGTSGLDLLENIRENYPKTKMIIMTAYGSPDIEEKIKNTENAYYVEKPFDIHELKNLIFTIDWNTGNYQSSFDQSSIETKMDMIFN